MKTLKTLSLVICIAFLSSCSNDKEKENLENELVLNSIELSSPKGFKIASSLKDLKKQIADVNGIAVNNIEIKSVEYLHEDKASIAFVNYKNSETGDASNLVIANGVYNYDAEHLKIRPFINSNKSSDGDVTISCGGCENCRVQGYRDGSTGNYHFSCESSCCTMTVKNESLN